MHRHGYRGRKLGLTRDPRRLLLKNLASELFERAAISTTLPKAKEVLPYAERLITKAKRGGLHNRRQVIAKLATKRSAHTLFDHLAPQLGGRVSGHLRIEKLRRRRGDNAQLARLSFVDELKEPAEKEPAAEEKAPAKPRKAASAKKSTPAKASRPAAKAKEKAS